MPENAGRKFGKGELYQHNVLNLVKALLRLSKEDLRLEDSRLEAAVQVAWVAQDKLKVTGEYKETTKRGERVFEGTTKQDLWQLVEKTGTPLQLPQRQRDDSSTNAVTRQADVVQNALYYLEDLGVLQDERPKKKRNTRYWIFTLILKHKDASIEENLGVLKQKLGLEMLPPTDKSIMWRDVCRTMLEKQKQLTTNRLMRADEMLFDIDRIRVDLALVERKQPDKRSGDDNPAQSQSYKPDYEETQKLEYKEFLATVLKASPSNKIAIIGEPGAGKTTLLQRIAFWILDKTDGLPIWIRLGNLPTPAPKLKEYLLNNWLEDAILNVTPKIRAEFEGLLTTGRVWLLLDGVDEMVANWGNPLSFIDHWIPGWCQQLSVVLTCRLNIWEANPHALNNFQTYRTLEFSQEKVHEFIEACFQKSNAALGIQLQQALNQPGKERIKDLMRNPLRLTLLCSTWHLREGKLPDTKAELYQQFVEEVYRWKKDEFPTTPEQRQQLNAKLKELALAAIDKEENRFCLRHKFVKGILGDRNDFVFQLALNIGWLNRVGVDAKNPNPNQPVYAFFHPTFQEYFAALAIADWDFFLPRAHDNDNPKPVSERYCIFEPQWKEVILLWLGREEVEQEQKEEFIKKLVELEDGCGYFYRYRAYFLAAAGIAEFRGCERIDEIIEQLIKWKFSAVNSENSQFRIPTIIAKEAEVALSQTHRQNVIDVLTRRLSSNPSKGNSLQVAEILVQISPGHPLAIKVIVDYLERSQETLKHSKVINLHRINTIGNLKKFATGNPIAIAALDKLSPNSQQNNNQTPSQFNFSLFKLPTGNSTDLENFINLMAEIDMVNLEKTISRLTNIDIIVGLLGRKPILQTSINELSNLKSIIEVLDRLNTSQNQLIFGFIQSINSFAVNRLAEIASSNSAVVPTLVEILNTSDDRDILQQVTWVLGKAASRNIDATTAVVRLLQTTEEQIIALDAIYFLKTVIKSGLLTVVVKGLKDYIEDTESYDILYGIFWHCAENMTYPAFYQAWHPQEEAGKTTTFHSQRLNQADLPQSLHTAIDNDSQLSQTIHLICIDGSQFIDPDRPAAEIYDQMLDQNCPECDEVPKTMPALKLYWNSLKRKSDKRPVLMFYASSNNPYSEAFLTDLSKFTGAICVVTSPPTPLLRGEGSKSGSGSPSSLQGEGVRGWGSLQFFAPSQAIADLVEWIRENVMEE